MFEEKRFLWLNSELAYRQIGSGPEYMIAFHGYDQDSSVFEAFEPSLGTRYSVISVDLPHQGSTIWNEEELSPDLMSRLISDFFQHLKINGTVAILGYSLGGNYALGMAYLKPELISSLWLIAADGLQRRPFFYFLTRNALGQFLFRRFINHASIIKSLIQGLNFVGIFSNKVARFYLGSIASPEDREKLYLRWTSSSRLAPNLKLAFAKFNQFNWPIFLIFGKDDQVISIANARKFKRYVKRASLVELKQGHQLIKSRNNDVIDAMIKRLDDSKA